MDRKENGWLGGWMHRWVDESPGKLIINKWGNPKQTLVVSSICF